MLEIEPAILGMKNIIYKGWLFLPRPELTSGMPGAEFYQGNRALALKSEPELRAKALWCLVTSNPGLKAGAKLLTHIS